LKDVQSLKLRFMDEQRAWQDAWPALSSNRDAPAKLPRAVEFTVELVDLGIVRRLFVIDATVIETVVPPSAGVAP
jgi:hypothetical protein